MTKIFKTPFGALGDKQEVPVSTQADGSVSYEQGFGVDYQRDYEDPQAKDIPREGLNQLFYDVTSALGELQKLGYMQWQPGEYQAGDRVAEGGVAYKAIRATTNKPPHADWVKIVESGDDAVLLTGNQTIADTKTFSSFPVTPSAAPTDDYQVANKKYADGISLGVGQTWMNLSSSRTHSTVYTNSTGKPIYVAITAIATEVSVPVRVDGVTVAVIGYTVYAEIARPASFIVAAGGSYTVAGKVKDMIWAELR